MRNSAFLALVAFAVLAPLEAAATDGCLNSYPVPTEPLPTSEAVTFRAQRVGQGFWATIWRNQCPAAQPRIWLRVVPDRDAAPFICGAGLKVVVGDSTRDVTLLTVPPPGGRDTFCGNLRVPTTLLVDQSPGQAYDSQQEVTFVYDGIDTKYSATLAAYGIGPPPPLAIENGIWWDPSQSGTGYGISVRNGVLVMQVYSYRSDGEPQWYVTAGPLVGGNRIYTGTLDKYVGGQCIDCPYTGRPTAAGNDGTITIQFNSATSANIIRPDGGMAAIVPFEF
jgi:hypothetical protein